MQDDTLGGRDRTNGLRLLRPTRYRGVFHQPYGDYLAAIRLGDGYLRLGTFRRIAAAAEAYNRAALRLHGPDALLNAISEEAA